MKNLVVYHSLSGNTEVVAKEISKLVGGDLEKIELIHKPERARLGWAAFSSIIGLNGKLKPLDFSLNDYDNVFIGGQVWAGHSSTPLNSFIHNSDYTNKNVFIFLTQADDKEPVTIFQSIAKRVENSGGKVFDTFYIQTQMKSVISPEMVKQPVSDWISKNALFSDSRIQTDGSN